MFERNHDLFKPVCAIRVGNHCMDEHRPSSESDLWSLHVTGNHYLVLVTKAICNVGFKQAGSGW